MGVGCHQRRETGDIIECDRPQVVGSQFIAKKLGILNTSSPKGTTTKASIIEDGQITRAV
jgi:hypothetical protein